MRIDKNPFVTRASEYIDMEERFIQLFSADILQLFSAKEYDFWTKVFVIRSSPGGGKTTLLKLFTPKVLQALLMNKDHNDHVRDIFSQLKGMEIFDKNDKINVVGAYIAFNTHFSTFEYLPFSAGQQLRVYFSLVNIRAILAFLKSLCLVRDFTHPQDLDRVRIKEMDIHGCPPAIRSFSSALTLYEWAIAQEEAIFESIDNINLKSIDNLVGTDDLYALDLLATKNIEIDGQPMKEHSLVMFDDVQNLSRSQRDKLVKTVIDKRPRLNTWIAERLKALSMEELLSEGQEEKRDLRVIELEKFWTKKYQQFEKFARSVANRRLESTFVDQNFDFGSFLTSSVFSGHKEKIEKALIVVRNRIVETFGKREQFKAWINQKQDVQGDFYTQLIEWRTLEIIITRENNKTSLFGALELTEDELEEQEGSSEKTASKLFIYREFGIPFYYGFDVVSRLSSSNIQQFLAIAADLFEEIKNNSVKRIIRSQTVLQLQPEKQQQIIQKLANEKWKSLATRVPEFDDIKRLIDAIGELCKTETYTPNAWNAPGINGIAITMAERNLLKDYALKDNTHTYHHLAVCLAYCISYNLLEVKLNYRVKGKDVMVIYINRLYCAKYDLPLLNGRFKERDLKTLLGYLTKGFSGQTKMKL